jgi:lipoate-protein ligase A
MNWKLIPSVTPILEGQMAFDAALFDAFQEGDTPILRFFRFPQTTLTLGRIEAKRIDLFALPFPHEIRPTGGRAVLHGSSDLCYAVIASVKDPLVGGSLLESYRKVSGFLASGINRLGRQVELTFERHKASEGPHCFSAPSFGELMLNGKKVAGSAQARRGQVFLQQGVILLFVDSGWKKLVPPGVESPMTGLNEEHHLPPVTAEQVEASIVEAFKAVGVIFEKP